MCSNETDMTPALGANNACDNAARICRRIELCCLSADKHTFAMDAQHVRSVQTGIALPQQDCLRSLGNRLGLLMLPDTTHKKNMILKILPHAWQMLDQGYSKAPQFSLVTDAR